MKFIKKKKKTKHANQPQEQKTNKELYTKWAHQSSKNVLIKKLFKHAGSSREPSESLLINTFFIFFKLWFADIICKLIKKFFKIWLNQSCIFVLQHILATNINIWLFKKINFPRMSLLLWCSEYADYVKLHDDPWQKTTQLKRSGRPDLSGIRM